MRTRARGTRFLPGLASTVGLLVLGAGLFSGAAHGVIGEGGHERQGGEPTPDPEEPLLFGAPGLEGSDHILSFVKKPPACEDDRLLLFWDAGRSTRELENLDARLQFDLGEVRYTVDVVAIPVPISPKTKEILAFTTGGIDPDFFRYAEGREILRIKVIGPEPLLDFLASIQQSFDISELNADRNQTRAQCEARNPATPTELPLAENRVVS